MEDSNHPGLSLPGATDDNHWHLSPKNVKMKYLFTLLAMEGVGDTVTQMGDKFLIKIAGRPKVLEDEKESKF